MDRGAADLSSEPDSTEPNATAPAGYAPESSERMSYDPDSSESTSYAPESSESTSFERDASQPESSEPDVMDFGEHADDADADRRHGRRALWISLLALVAVFAVAGAVITIVARPKPGHVGTPTHVAGFALDTTSAAAATASYLRTAVTAGMSLGSSVAAVYADDTGAAHSVIFVGGTTSKGSQTERMKTLLGMLDDATDGVAQVTH